MKVDVTVPNGKSGKWEVSEFTISRDDALWFNFQNVNRSVFPGIYKKLSCSGKLIMSNTPAEVEDHVNFIRVAKKGGHILINGLGLGVCLTAILESNEVKSVTVIEKSSDVINLVGSHFTDPRIEIINADALTWKAPKGVRYDAVWHDIWRDICSDNLPDMIRLHRKYGRRCDWQGSWCRRECEKGR